MSRLAFFALESLLWPAQLAGGLAYERRVARLRRDQGSGTAHIPLVVRALLHDAGSRPDPVASVLAARAPCTAGWVFQGMRSLGWSVRASGWSPSTLRYPPNPSAGMAGSMTGRTAFFDQAVAQAIDDGVRQVVVLGAGYDSRTLSLPAHVAGFEIDDPATLGHKLAALDDAGIDRSAVRYVQTDYDSVSWQAGLLDAGFDPSVSTLVLWEGVTYYLERDTIHATLAQLAEAGHRVAFDYFTPGLLHGDVPELARTSRLFCNGMRKYGEPLKTALTEEELAPMLAAAGLSLQRHTAFAEGEHPVAGAVVAGPASQPTPS